MLGILGIFPEVKESLPRFGDREAGVNPQHLCGLSSRLLKLPQLSVGGCQQQTRRQYGIGFAHVVPEQSHRVCVTLEHVTGLAHQTRRIDGYWTRIETKVCL